MKNSTRSLSIAVALLGVMIACRGETQTAPAAAPAAAVPATAGVGVKGVVKFTGAAPAPVVLKREADPFCAKTKMNDETVVVNPNGTLKNVAVRVIKGAAPTAAPATPQQIVVDQNNCMYRPRVTTAVANQKIIIRNSDPVLHNVHAYLGTATTFNRAQPKGSKDVEQSFTAGVHRLKCDVHPWMTGWVVANDNSYVAVTGDNGEFALNLPPGTYTLEAWHEKYGTKTADVTVTAGQTAAVDFSFAGQ